MNTDYKVRYINTNGKRRKIITYENEQKRKEHSEIKTFLEGNLKFSKFTKAYIAKSSIYKNARAHMYNDIFIKYDIENFFNSVDHKILVEILFEQLNLGGGEKKYSILEVSELVSKCIFGKRGLPLGLITSPVLANIYLKKFDNILYGKFKKIGLENIIYTRYADDLIISFKNSSNYDLDKYSEALNYIEEIITKQLKKYKLRINLKKKSIINLKISNHVRITGISVTKDKQNKRRLSVGNKRIKELYDDALQVYIKKQNKDYVLTDEDFYNICRIKGMESFILSVHKTGYDHFLSGMMQEKLKKFGFSSLHELIKNLN